MRLCQRFAGQRRHQQYIEFRVIQVRERKRALSVPWGGLIQVPEERLLRVGCSTSLAASGHLWSGEACSLPVKGALTDWRNALARTSRPVQMVHGCRSLGDRRGVVVFQKGFQQLHGGFWSTLGAIP